MNGFCFPKRSRAFPSDLDFVRTCVSAQCRIRNRFVAMADTCLAHISRMHDPFISHHLGSDMACSYCSGVAAPQESALRHVDPRCFPGAHRDRMGNLLFWFGRRTKTVRAMAYMARTELNTDSFWACDPGISQPIRILIKDSLIPWRTDFPHRR